MMRFGAERPGRLAAGLSWALAAGMAVQAAVGLLVPGVYRDAAWVRAAWFGNDIVTLVVGVPLLAGGLAAALRGSVRGRLVWLTGLAYGVYNYAYYTFGARLGVIFPLFVALLVGAIWTLILAVASTDVPALASRVRARTPARVASVYAGLTGIGLAIAWLAQWAAYVFGGKVPSIGVGPFQLVAALDLGLIVPAMLVGAVLLWRRDPWGYLVGFVAIAQGAVYTAVLTAGSLVGGLRGLRGLLDQVPVWGVWTLVGAAAALVLLRSVGSGERSALEARAAAEPAE